MKRSWKLNKSEWRIGKELVSVIGQKLIKNSITLPACLAGVGSSSLCVSDWHFWGKLQLIVTSTIDTTLETLDGFPLDGFLVTIK